MYDCVLCCASASPTISTPTISAFLLGSLTAMFLVQVTYYGYTLTIYNNRARIGVHGGTILASSAHDLGEKRKKIWR